MTQSADDKAAPPGPSASSAPDSSVPDAKAERAARLAAALRANLRRRKAASAAGATPDKSRN